MLDPSVACPSRCSVGGVLGRVVASIDGRVPCLGTPEVDPAASFTDVDDVGPIGAKETP